MAPSNPHTHFSVTQANHVGWRLMLCLSIFLFLAGQSIMQLPAAQVDYFQTTQPGGPDDPTPPELRSLLPFLDFMIYLPLINR